MAVPPLQALVAAGFDVCLVVTRIDKRRGRGGDLAPSPVKAAALKLGLAVSHTVNDVVTADADLGVVVAFGQLIKLPVLERVPLINLHFSLLPRWRGAAPIERAILAGDTVTGVGIMRLEEGLDTGPLFDVVEVPIGPRQTADGLRHELVEIGAQRLVECLQRGLGEPTAQTGDATYAAKLDPREFEIDWHRSAQEVDRLVRIGLAWTEFRGKRLKVLASSVETVDAVAGVYIGDLVVGCGQGSLQLDRVQPEGKPAMAAAAWANGAQPRLGELFGRTRQGS
jgi:methionyl-tRNA formyltransferase